VTSPVGRGKRWCPLGRYLERKCARFDTRAEISEWLSPHPRKPKTQPFYPMVSVALAGDWCVEAKRSKRRASALAADADQQGAHLDQQPHRTFATTVAL
jgi:hypothetical protein